MFSTFYIYELISGQLSIDGYKHFINTVSNFVKKNNWPKSIILSIDNNILWSSDEIKELTHQFFEWSLIKGKFNNIDKIPESYLSYYFSQILISFIANRIKEEQQKEGLSYEKCRELVISVSNHDYIVCTIGGKEYVFIDYFSEIDIKTFEDELDILSFLSKIPIYENTKHFRPLVKKAIDNIFRTIGAPISIYKLTEIIHKIFNQKGLTNLETENDFLNGFDLEILNEKFDEIIKDLILGLKKDDAKMISHFLFNNESKQSLAEIADIYCMPKSTFHNKIDLFKKKISRSYIPDNEEYGILFLQKISKALDKISN